MAIVVLSARGQIGLGVLVGVVSALSGLAVAVTVEATVVAGSVIVSVLA